MCMCVPEMLVVLVSTACENDHEVGKVSQMGGASGTKLQEAFAVSTNRSTLVECMYRVEMKQNMGIDARGGAHWGPWIGRPSINVLLPFLHGDEEALASIKATNNNALHSLPNACMNDCQYCSLRILCLSTQASEPLLE